MSARHPIIAITGSSGAGTSAIGLRPFHANINEPFSGGRRT